MTRALEPGHTAEHIEQAAAQWVTRLDLQNTPAVYAGLEAWLAENPRHRAAFLRLCVAWNRADALKNLASLDGEVDENLLAPPCKAQGQLDEAQPAVRRRGFR